ncbi:hypothetical protein DFJ73DRAFT_117566 [Zopfochytrium polystomum]|nr:hypothetical protein DFJ73DRAFT_117566 [Zopfochytrium polystomum]
MRKRHPRLQQLPAPQPTSPSPLPKQAGPSTTSVAKYPADPAFSYFPDRGQWVERQIRNAPRARGIPLPEGFPEKIEGPSVWDGFEVQNHPEKWLYTFTPADNADLRAALDHWKSLNLPLTQLSRATFPLSDALKARTEIWVDQILNGLGFLQIRGFDIDAYSDEDAIVVYAGLASYVGDKRLNQQNGVLMHVRADPEFQPQDISAPAQQTVSQVFHTDAIPGGNIVSFLVLSHAASGGDTQLSSVGQVYNALARTRPDIVATLAQDWVLDIGNYFHGVPGRHAVRPLLTYDRDNGRVVAAIARRSVTGFGIWGRHRSLPPVSDAQKEALDSLHFLAAARSVSVPVRRGDMQFVNNYEVFHAREAYVDEPLRTRHLVRLWLASDRVAWADGARHWKGQGETRFERVGDEEVWNFDHKLRRSPAAK